MDEQDYEEMGAHAQVTGMTQKAANEAAQYYLEEKEKGIVDIQLEVDSIKSDIYHLLKQDRLSMEGDTQKVEWKPIEDKERTLTDWGVERIMQTIHFYINKNTLLTNFDEKQIRTIMLTFMREINDLVLLKYEYLFRVPTDEECMNLVKEKIAKEKKMQGFIEETLGKSIEEQKYNIKEELKKAREKKIEENIREYGLLIAQLEVMVYATLNRAFRGEERGSIRRHTQISELIGGRSPLPQKSGGVFSWGSK